ncbi:PKD domain [Trinorchestia longiramus]|nr:PKD domain [Trinorchestia longiramus]
MPDFSHGVANNCHVYHGGKNDVASTRHGCHGGKNDVASTRHGSHGGKNDVASTRHGCRGGRSDVVQIKRRQIRLSSAKLVTFVCCILATVITPSSSTAADKCVVEDVMSPVWTMTGYPGMPSPSVCTAWCSSLQLTSTGIEEAAYCFCSQNETRVLQQAEGVCDLKCQDGSTCGGSIGDGISAWIANFESSQISISELIVVGKTVKVAVNSSGLYYIDWGDGAVSMLGFTTHDYTQTGHFSISAVLLDNAEVNAQKTVTILEGPADFSLECPEAVEVGVPTLCNTSVEQGYNFSFSGHISSEFQNLTFQGNVPDAVLDVYGSAYHPENATESSFVTQDGVNIVIVRGGPVKRTGVLLKVWVWATSAFEMDIVELTPMCSTGVFCAGACRSDCPDTCATFCVVSGTCAAAPTTCTEQGSPTQFDTAVIASISGPDNIEGEEIMLQTPVSVSEGTYLGFVSSSRSELRITDVSNTKEERLRDALVDPAGNITMLDYQ